MLEGARDFAGLVKNYVDIKTFDSELVHTLIEKIFVHQKEVVDGNASDDNNTISFVNKKN